MYAELLAIVAAFLTAFSSVMATKGMKEADADTANLVLTGSQAFILTILLLVDVPELNFLGLVWFAFAGICASFVGRVFTLKSYKEIGVSVSSAIVGTSPLVVVFFAILFLGETFSIPVLLGSLFVVGGIALINLKAGRFTIDLGSLYLPIGASILFAVGNILRKMGTTLLPHSVLGAQFSTVAGLASCVVYMGLRGSLRINISRNTGFWLVGSGVVNAFAWITLTMAISLGRVSVMSAIIYSYPLFSVLLAKFMLRESESLTRNTILGCILIVLGVALVSLLG